MLELRDEMLRRGLEVKHNTRLAMLHAFAGAGREGGREVGSPRRTWLAAAGPHLPGPRAGVPIGLG